MVTSTWAASASPLVPNPICCLPCLRSVSYTHLYNLAGELWQIRPLLDALGIRILSCISGDGRYHEVAQSHRAKAAMMVCSKSLSLIHI